MAQVQTAAVEGEEGTLAGTEPSQPLEEEEVADYSGLLEVLEEEPRLFLSLLDDQLVAKQLTESFATQD